MQIGIFKQIQPPEPKKRGHPSRLPQELQKKFQSQTLVI